MNLDGFIITKVSRKNFEETSYNQILDVLEPVVGRMKNKKNSMLIKGTTTTEGYNLFYLGITRNIHTLLVIVGDSSLNIDHYLAYLYFIGEILSRVLENETKNYFPTINLERDLSFIDENTQNSKKQYLYPIILFGEPRSGKTSLIDTLFNSEVTREYIPTIGLSIRKKYYHLSKHFALEFLFLDIGGHKIFENTRQSYFDVLPPKAILIVFDISKELSFENAIEWLEEAIYYLQNKKTNYILIGNKIDLVQNTTKIRKKATKIAKNYNLVYFETSALNGGGLDQIINYIISNLNL